MARAKSGMLPPYKGQGEDMLTSQSFEDESIDFGDAGAIKIKENKKEDELDASDWISVGSPDERPQNFDLNESHESSDSGKEIKNNQIESKPGRSSSLTESVDADFSVSEQELSENEGEFDGSSKYDFSASALPPSNNI
jgi:hypothetical protein